MRLLLSSLSVCISAIALAYILRLPHRFGTLDSLLQPETASRLRNLFAIPTKEDRGIDQDNINIPFPRSPASFASRAFSTRLASNMTVPRKIHKAFLAREQSEGAGAKVRRSIGTPQLRNFSPFLMLDHFHVHPGAGFPDHPHRGQETITYVLKGVAEHEDFAGNAGVLHPGDLQFMTAGRGIMHSEVPNPNHGDNIGMQLWVDLPKELKMCEPRYRDLRADEIPRVKLDDGRVDIKVISGKSHGVDSVRDLAYTPVWIFDIEIQPGGKVTQELPPGWNAFAYTLEGTTNFFPGTDEETTVGQYHNVVFERDGDEVSMEVPADATEKAKIYLVAGQPLDQKVVQYGPFVMNTNEEIYQTMMDYQTHSNGFERAKGWESKIGKAVYH